MATPTKVEAGQPGAWPIYGHTGVVQLLQRLTQPSAHQPSYNTLHHAYLFWGPRQIGKSTLVRRFAQAILCTASVQRPCGECRACRLMNKGVHPDYRLIQPVDKNGTADRLDGTLRVEQAADVIRDALLRPVEGRYKVFFIQDAHQANDGFANKLLKTLEEPPPHIVLCLTALERTRVLPTIVSRCQPFELRPLAANTIRQALCDQWQRPLAEAELLARLANGRLGWAVEQLHHPEGQQERSRQLQTLWRLMQASRIERLAFAEQLATQRNSDQLFGLLELWSTWCRDLLLVQNNCSELCCNVDQPAILAQQAQAVAPMAIQHYLQVLKRIEGYLHHTVNTRLALDVLLLQLPSLTQET